MSSQQAFSSLPFDDPGLSRSRRGRIRGVRYEWHCRPQTLGWHGITFSAVLLAVVRGAAASADSDVVNRGSTGDGVNRGQPPIYVLRNWGLSPLSSTVAAP